MKDQVSGHENAGPENEGPNIRAWKCRTWKWRTKCQGMKMQELKMKDLLGMFRAFVIRYNEHLWRAYTVIRFLYEFYYTKYTKQYILPYTHSHGAAPVLLNVHWLGGLGPENGEPKNMKDTKMQDLKMTCFLMNMLVLRSFMFMYDLWAFRYSS